MARKLPKAESNQAKHAKLLMPHGEAEDRLKERISIGYSILEREINTKQELKAARADYYTWNDYNEDLLKRMVDTDELASSYTPGFGGFFAGIPSLSSEIQEHREDIQNRLRRLNSILNRLELIPEDPPIKQIGVESSTTATTQSKRVFVVHGHDEEAKQAIARLLENLGFEPIILHEQPNKGRTIIEKFEDYSDVGFAIVLLTPDDVGGLASSPENLTARARQNVVFELGFFVGRLGRKHVCTLLKGDVETPSDLSGLLYVPMDDAGGWNLPLAKEMKAAGLNVDLNKLV